MTTATVLSPAALRVLEQQRLRIRCIGDELVVATCRSSTDDSASYVLGFIDGRYHCECRQFSFRGRCSHLEALCSVTGGSL